MSQDYKNNLTNSIRKKFYLSFEKQIWFEEKSVEKLCTTLLNIYFSHGKNSHINLTDEEISYLISKSSFKKDSNFHNAVNHNINNAILFFEPNNLQLNESHWDYLIRNSSLSLIDRDGYSLLMKFAARCPLNKVKISDSTLDYFINNSDLSLHQVFSFNIFHICFKHNKPLLEYILVNKFEEPSQIQNLILQDPISQIKNSLPAKTFTKFNFNAYCDSPSAYTDYCSILQIQIDKLSLNSNLKKLDNVNLISNCLKI